MQEILMLTTGGTIAGQPGSTGLEPKTQGGEMLQLLPNLRSRCGVSVQEVFNLDSSNIHPADWQRLARVVYAHLDNYDGFVISHGTDTMAYSAAALSYMLRGLDKPVVFTGSQLPIVQPDSDGLTNLADAFSVALAEEPGVFVVFAGKIIRGCRASKLYTHNLEAFASINVPELGRVTAGRVAWRSPPEHFPEPRRLVDTRESKVLLLKLAPGMEPDLIECAVAAGYKGLVVEAYGVGNVPDSLQNALKQALAAGLAVVVTSQCPFEQSDMSVYGPGYRALEAGAIPAYDTPTEALYAKLCWALSRSSDLNQVRKIMNANLAGEVHVH